MKFVRIGALKTYKQVQYQPPHPEIWASCPPRPQGFFAFPAGYMDGVFFPLERPPEDPSSLLQYFRDENGKKMTRKDFYDLVPVEEASYPHELKLRESARRLLKKRRIKEKDIKWFERPSYVMYYPDCRQDLTFSGLGTDHENTALLNQSLEFLLQLDGEKIPAQRFFRYCFTKKCPDNYRGDYQAPVPDEDFDPDQYIYGNDSPDIKISSLLKMRNVKPEQLCIWPVYPDMEECYATTIKKYRVFEYNGCLWHHLGEYLKRSEILSQFSDTWFYTDMQSYEKALRKANGITYHRKMKYQRGMSYIGHYGAHEASEGASLSEMYEVFFDTDIH